MAEQIKDRIKAYIKSKGLTIREFERKINASNGYVGSMRNYPSPDMVSQIALSFPDLNLSWLFFGTGTMLTGDAAPEATPEATTDLIPDLPLDAAAGFTDDIDKGITPQNCDMYPRIAGAPSYDLTIPVRGDSMEPLFQSGDRIAIRRCVDIVEWGAPHVLDTSEGIYIKRIFDDGENIVCTSENPRYKDFTIPKQTVRGLYKVVAMVRIL